MSRIIGLAMFASTVSATLALGGCAANGAPARTAADYEQSACVEVSDADRDQGPFARTDRIVRVEPLAQSVSPKAPAPPAGVAVYVRATPGMTEQWLGRVVQCHVAHEAARGAAEAGRDPLAVDGVNVAVSSTPTSFRVAITSPNVERARRIVLAGDALAAR